MAQSYHQLGIVAQLRGAHDDAEAWYLKSLAIKEALGDRPGLAKTYANLGVLAEARGDLASALSWAIRSVTLFEPFGHSATGRAPQNLALLMREHGEAALIEAWRIVTGQAPPEAVLETLRGMGGD